MTSLQVLDDHQSSLLHEAAKNGHFKVVSLLLSCCEKQNMNLLEQKDISGFTPLLYSCKNGHLKVSFAFDIQIINQDTKTMRLYEEKHLHSRLHLINCRK